MHSVALIVTAYFLRRFERYFGSSGPDLTWFETYDAGYCNSFLIGVTQRF